MPNDALIARAQKMESHEHVSWDRWRDLHQPFELDWWREHHQENFADPAFTEKWAAIRQWIDAPAGPWLDIGCGPRPPFAPCTVIEPLANDYIAMVGMQWWKHVDISDGPAEKRVEELQGRFASVSCWNALDHMIGWREALANMAFYAKDDGVISLSVDFQGPFLGHPGVPEAEFRAEVRKLFTLTNYGEPAIDGRMSAMRLCKQISK